MTAPTRTSIPLPARQRGAVLAVALIFLFLLTLIGVAALRSTLQQQRMAGNIEQLGTAFQGAETGIAAVIAELIAKPGELNAANTASNKKSFDYWIVNDTVCKTTDISGDCNPSEASPANTVNMDLSAWFVAQSKQPAPCNSLGKDEGNNPSAMVNFFVVRGAAAYSAARSDHIQGLTSYPKTDPGNEANCKP